MKYNKNYKIDKYNIIFHNTVYDDIIFLIPLYNILFNETIVVICDEIYVLEKYSYNYYRSLNYNYSLYKNCIYFNIHYLKLLHLHTDLLRNCRFNNVYNKLKLKLYDNIVTKKICNINKYSLNYSIVTTLYRRNNTFNQLKLFSKQIYPPKSIIIVHDRNFINYVDKYENVIYFHTTNFAAGFYFRYLVSILSPEDNVIIYDDDYNVYNNLSHYNWINSINKETKGIYGNRIGRIRDIKWCAAPLIIKRRLLLLEWIYPIYEPSQAEDGHLSFSIFLLCGIKCYSLRLEGLIYMKDRMASPRKELQRDFWHVYAKDIIHKINSTYVYSLKELYKIY